MINFNCLLLTFLRRSGNALLGNQLITILAHVSAATDTTLSRMALEIG